MPGLNRNSWMKLSQLVWLASFLAPVPTEGQNPEHGRLASRIDSIVESARDSQSIPGISVGVVLGRDTIVLKGYGLADLENDVPASEHSVYQIASVSKQFTAAGILALEDDGRLSVDEEMTKYFPDYVTNGRRITIRHLLNHTHGLQEYNRPETQGEWGAPLTHERFLSLMKDQPFDFPVGERFQYRNTGFYFAAMIIEQLGGDGQGFSAGAGLSIGVPLGVFLEERFFRPLGMTGTSDCGNRPLIKHRAQGYSLEGETVVNKALLHMTWPFGVGSLCSSVVDLLAWSDALHGGQVLSQRAYSDMITPATLNDGSRTRYGLGIGVSEFEGHRTIAHSGGTVGYSTFLSYFPDDDLTIVLLTNRDGINPDRIHEAIARVVLTGR